MKTTFDEIIEIVLEHEGGYVNDPKDLGGETKYGITKRFYPDVDIKNLTKEEAEALATRAIEFKKVKGRLPVITSSDAWEKRMAEGIQYLVNLRANGS